MKNLMGIIRKKMQDLISSGIKNCVSYGNCYGISLLCNTCLLVE